MRRGLLGLSCLLIAVYVGCGSNADDPAGKAGNSGSSGSTAKGGGAGTASGGFGALGASGGSAGTAGASGGAAGTTTSGGSSGSGGTGGGSGGSSGTSAPDGSVPDVVFTYDAPVGPGGDACAATSVTAESLPLDVYIIQDKSGSMHDPQGMPIPFVNPGGDCDIGQTVDSKWCRAINALNGFFSAPTSSGMGVALNFFGGNDCAALNAPQVAMQTLPAHLSQLQMALNAINPNGSTPTMAAAQGIVGYTQTNQRPGRKIIGVIVTDGDPMACDTNVTNIGNVLRNHFNMTGIATYLIGMDGASFNNLQSMANGAGAPSHTSYCGGNINPCHFYNVGNGNPQAFIDALKAIQQTAVACEFAMPKPARGVVDISKVKVSYLAGGQPPPQEIPRVNGAGQCGGSGGWYFDNNTTPTRILLCPETCRAVSGDLRAQIDVFLGCLLG